MPIPNVPTEALRDAMGQFDRDLRDAPDWRDWEQKRAYRYAIEHAGQHYPVKQIVSMATGTPVSDFSGGRAAGDANRYVSDRGLKVIELRPRNPDWVRDELILALDIYLRYAGNPPRKGSAEIDELSETLNRLARYLGITRGDRFRNINGVYMKLMNFRRFDPVFTQAGKVGLSRGGKAEEDVWNEFAGDPERCHEVAETVRQVLASAQEGETVAEPAGDLIEEAEEGRVVSAMHRRYERNPALVEAKKRRALAKLGADARDDVVERCARAMVRRVRGRSRRKGDPREVQLIAPRFQLGQWRGRPVQLLDSRRRHSHRLIKTLL